MTDEEIPVEFAGLVLEDQLLDHLGTPEGCTAVWKERLNPEVVPETLEDYQLYRDAINVVLMYMDEHREPPHISVLAEEIGNSDFNIPIAPIDYVIDRLKERYKRRALKSILGKQGQELAKAEKDPDAIITDAADRLAQLRLDTSSRKNVVSSDDLIQTVMDYRQRLEGGHKGISFGFDKVNNHMGGLNPTELTVLLARPKRYKSWLLLNSAASALEEDKNVAFATLELSEDEMRDRFTCMMAGVSWSHFKSKTLRQEEEERMIETSYELQEHPFKAHFFRPRVGERSVGHIVSYALEKNADVLYIDQLSWLDGARDERAWQKIGEIMEQLKDAANSFPILMAAQLNREAQAVDGLPDIAKAGLSDFIGQTADNLFALHASKDMMQQQPRIIHLGLMESRSYEPMGWEINVKLSEDTSFHCLDPISLG